MEGAPAHCVILGVDSVLAQQPPDLVPSSISYGHSVADGVMVCGTVGGVIEGTLRGALGIALSQSYDQTSGNDDLFAAAHEHGAAVECQLRALDNPPRTCFNVNFPVRRPGHTREFKMATLGVRADNALHVKQAKQKRLTFELAVKIEFQC